MTSYIQITFAGISPGQQEWLIAHLADADYEGFEESENELKAFIPENLYDRSLLLAVASRYGLSYTEQPIEAQNWNAVWESNFEPVVVDDFVTIRAGFHEPAKGVEHEIIITPKMSFGTGHHATTFMMLQQMRGIDFQEKTVLDFGTGTGVLAILAQKLGAKKIIAIDYDDWSIENAGENIVRNACAMIELVKTDAPLPGQWYDVILANINKNVIVENIQVLSSQLMGQGILLLSGLLPEDEPEIRKAAEEQLLVFGGRTEKSNWLCLKFLRES